MKTVTTPTLVIVRRDTTERTVRTVGIVNTPKLKCHTCNNANNVITVKILEEELRTAIWEIL